jgi:tetratricopeptide (TPR) repeat protein
MLAAHQGRIYLTGDPGNWARCLPLFREALALLQRIGDRPSEAEAALNLGNARTSSASFTAGLGDTDTDKALRHFQQSIQHKEPRGDILGAGQTRYNIALLVADADRADDALLCAHAALDNYQQAGPGAPSHADRARQLIIDLEQRSR